MRAIVIAQKDSTHVKIALAQLLYNKGQTQQAISKLLHITQPQVSNYLKQGAQPSALEIASQILNLHQDISKLSFNTIVSSNSIAPTQEYTLSHSKEKLAILSELSLAITTLKEKNYHSLIPQVKMNIALASTSATTKQDIASLPTGLVFNKNKLSHAADPEFGCSTHLATILLYLRKHHSDLRCIMNVKYLAKLAQKAQQIKLQTQYLDDQYKLQSDAKADILIHKGSFGIEPMAYILGSNTQDVISKCDQLQ